MSGLGTLKVMMIYFFNLNKETNTIPLFRFIAVNEGYEGRVTNIYLYCCLILYIIISYKKCKIFAMLHHTVGHIYICKLPRNTPSLHMPLTL